MNVLILTPDRVGSTLLQRVLTVYMLRKGFSEPVINLHELSTGIQKYIHPELQTEVLSKTPESEWGYSQPLSEVVELLKSVNHFKTSRLAQYHIKRRTGDTVNEQAKFYKYLNENFFIIRCQRQNIFEQALSWEIKGHSGSNNVVSMREKCQVFADIYKDGITVTKRGLRYRLEEYKQYIKWSETHFNIQSYFNYEESINDLEKYIMGLDFMAAGESNTWEGMFGIDFNTWNQCHKGFADIALLPPPPAGDNVLLNQKLLPYSPIEKSTVAHNLPMNLPVDRKKAEFLIKYGPAYKSAQDHIAEAVKSGFLFDGIPIKLQTFSEKQKLIKNFDECVTWYNEWVTQNNVGELYDAELSKETIQPEENSFNDFSLKNRLIRSSL